MKSRPRSRKLPAVSACGGTVHVRGHVRSYPMIAAPAEGGGLADARAAFDTIAAGVAALTRALGAIVREHAKG